jgi:hypothetical protein
VLSKSPSSPLGSKVGQSSRSPGLEPAQVGMRCRGSCGSPARPEFIDGYPYLFTPHFAVSHCPSRAWYEGDAERSEDEGECWLSNSQADVDAPIQDTGNIKLGRPHAA